MKPQFLHSSLPKENHTCVLIPAAGFGSRVGYPPAKELLPHPLDGRPLVEHALKLGRCLGAPIVISRNDKHSLNDYVKNKLSEKIIEISHTKEWPETILRSSQYWKENNLIIFPDALLSPSNAHAYLLEGLKQGADLTLGIFPVDHPKEWGMVRLGESIQENFPNSNFYSTSLIHVAEKPNPNDFEKKLDLRGIQWNNLQNNFAWGVIGFKKNIGEQLFSKLIESSIDHQYKELNLRVKYFFLNNYWDFAR